MLKRGNRGELVRELQEQLLSLGYELPEFGADGDFGEETESAVSQFKEELIELAEQDGVSSKFQRLIDALVIGEWKRPSAKPFLSLSEIEELVTSIYDAFHPLVVRSEETEHVESLQRALKRLGFYAGKIDGIFGNGTRRSVLFEDATSIASDAVACKRHSLKWTYPLLVRLMTRQRPQSRSC